MNKAPAASSYPLSPALRFLERLWQLNHALETLSGHMQRELGVTSQQRLIVRCLGKYPGMTAGQLAALLHVDPGTLSAALRRLEGKRLVKRRQDPRDKRRVALGLTAKGRALDTLTEGTVEHAVERLLVSATEADLAATAGVLLQLTEHLNDECR